MTLQFVAHDKVPCALELAFYFVAWIHMGNLRLFCRFVNGKSAKLQIKIFDDNKILLDYFPCL